MRFDRATGTFLDEFVAPGSGGLDNATYLLFSIPEPTTLLLAGMGAGLWLLRRRRERMEE